MTPTQRSLELLRARGWDPWIVERFRGVPGKGGKRVDLYGLWDLVAIEPFSRHINRLWGVQTFTTAVAEHMLKMLGNDRLGEWLKAGEGEVHGWRKLKAFRGSETYRWRPRIWRFTRNPTGLVDVHAVHDDLIDHDMEAVRQLRREKRAEKAAGATR